VQVGTCFSSMDEVRSLAGMTLVSTYRVTRTSSTTGRWEGKVVGDPQVGAGTSVAQPIPGCAGVLVYTAGRGDPPDLGYIS
jgi:hypothetical protein